MSGGYIRDSREQAKAEQIDIGCTFTTCSLIHLLPRNLCSSSIDLQRSDGSKYNKESTIFCEAGARRLLSIDFMGFLKWKTVAQFWYHYGYCAIKTEKWF